MEKRNKLGLRSNKYRMSSSTTDLDKNILTHRPKIENRDVGSIKILLAWEVCI